LQPFNEQLHETKAEVLQKKGSLKDAIADCTDAIKIKPTAESLVLRSSLYKANKQLKEAVADLNEAILLEPNDIDLRRRRGALERKLGQWQPAYADYKFVMDACPGSPKARAEFEEVEQATPVALRHG
jgi:tetratricopeptide (TPR) repeat protein